MNYVIVKHLRSGMEKIIHCLEPRSVLPTEQFPWAKSVEAEFVNIKSEAQALLTQLPQIVNFNQVLPSQRALTQDDLWKSYFLIGLGEDVLPHQKNCPLSTKALKKIPGVINAFFSILLPGTHIPAHRGPYAGILRYHLGVIIPQGDCAIRVDQNICPWEEGESLFFDDSFEHEAWNRTKEIRVVLFVDIVRPLPPILSQLNQTIIWLFERTQAARAARKVVWNHLVENNNLQNLEENRVSAKTL